MNVVIIGGGFCGAFIAKKLEKDTDLDIVLIDKKSYFEYQPSLHKIITKPQLISKLHSEYRSFLHRTHIFESEINSVTKKYVEISKQKIPYDILIITTGIDYPIYLDNTENVYVLKNGSQALAMADSLLKARHVLIAGGGVIGTEIAGEIATKLPHKNVTIVHSGSRLIDRNKSDASIYAEKFLRKNNVNIIFNEKLVNHERDSYKTDKNRIIKADMCIWCAGIKCNPHFMSDFPSHCFSKRNALEVDNYLQLHGFSNIFVGGDINSFFEEKTARKAELHAKYIVRAIKKMKKGKMVKPYKTGTSPMVIGLGDWSGVIIFKWVFPALFAAGILKWAIQWWVMRQLR